MFNSSHLTGIILLIAGVLLLTPLALQGSRIILLTGCVDEYSDAGNWSNDHALGLTFDDQYRVTQKMEKMWDWDNDYWINYNRLNIYYNAEGNVSQVISEDWMDNAWYPYSRRTLFWSNGLVDSVLVVSVSGDETYPISSYYCTYNNQTGRIASIITNENSGPETRWLNRRDFIFDQQGRLVTVGMAYDNAGNWVTFEKTTTSYQPEDQSGYQEFWTALLDELSGGIHNLEPRGMQAMLLQDSHLYLSESGEFSEYARQEYSYSAEQRLEQVLNYSIYDGEFYLDIQQDLSYDASGLLQQYLTSYNYGGTPTPTARRIFTYQEFVDNDDALIDPPQMSIGTAPNPFSNELRIKLQSDARTEAKLEVFNLRGQKLSTLFQGTMSGTQELLWQGTDERGQKHSSGIYLLRLTAGESVQTSKVLLLKGD